MIKKTIVAVLCFWSALIVPLFLPPPVKAKAPILSASEIEYPPFCIVDDQGRPDGFSVELMRTALAAMGREVVFRTGPWAEVKGWLEKGEVEALPLVGRTPEREPFFDFTFPYMTLHGAIVVRTGTTNVWDLDDLRERRVAVMAGDNAEEFLRRRDYGVDIHTTDSFKEALRQLSRGLHDAVFIQRLVALRLIRESGLTNLRIVDNPIREFSQDFCFAVKKDDRKNLALLNEGLALVIADGTYRRLHHKWFAALELPGDRRTVVGGDHNYPPYEYLDEKGRPTGFNVDLTRAIARKVGLAVDIRLGPWAEMRRALNRGEIDVIQGMLYSPERDMEYDFAPSHITNHYVAVGRKGEESLPDGIEALAGKRIIVQEGDIMHDLVVENGLDDQLSVVDAQEEALRALARGEHDLALVTRLTALYFIEKNNWKNLVIGDRTLASFDYCYAFPDDRKALVAQFSEGLKALESSGEYRRIYEQWMGAYQEPPGMINFLRYAALVVLPLLLILLLTMLWLWSMRRQVALKTEQLRRSDEFQRAMIACSPVALYSLDLDGRVLTWNASAELVFGWKAEEVIGRPLPIVPPDRQPEFETMRQGVLTNGAFYGREIVRQKKDGTRFHVSLSAAPIHDAAGAMVGILSFAEDITDRKRAEEALRESEQHFRNLADSGMALIWTSGTDKQCDYFNRTWLEFTGRTLEQELGSGWTGGVHADDLTFCLKTFSDAFDRRERFSMIYRLRRHDGLYRWIQDDGSPRYDSSGAFLGYIGHCLDISDLKFARERIEHLNNVLRSIREVNQLIVRERDPDSLIREACRLLVANRGYVGALIILTDDQERPLSWAEAGLQVNFEAMDTLLDQGHLPPCCLSAASGKVAVFSGPDTVCRTCPIDKGCVIADAMCVGLLFGGVIWGYLAVVLERGLVEDTEDQDLFLEIAQDIAYAISGLRGEAAREASELKSLALEGQLRQAQKLESVGRLAGGVAHDFNNMLSVIIGYAELGLQTISPDDHLHADLTEILNAASRSSDITRKLLAFARKQTIMPQILDLNETVEGMLKMLRRLIGEDIDLAWMPGPGLWPVNMDPVQVDQILANLCVNARDAIVGVGEIIIETDNVHLDENYCADQVGVTSGEFVMLVVSDNGCGMDRETRDNIFEPFYTTKDVSRGTGLGLAMVYGIVKQNNGLINVYSEPDRGTTFRIYLPRHVDTAAVKPAEAAIHRKIPSGSGETVLLVEDETAILEMGRKILASLDYHVLAADTPGRARELAAACGGRIDLLITDVIMPEMNGRDLAEKLSALYPEMKTLFMSGYTADAIARHGVLEAGVNFIQKPFSVKGLAIKVREVLSD